MSLSDAQEARLYIRSSIVTALIFGATLPAQAAGPATVPLTLAADVASFCRIDATEHVVAAGGSIGRVREICNTAGSYRVSAVFTNVRAGSVNVDGEQVVLDATGVANIVTSGPRAQARAWSVADARPVDSALPMRVRFMVAPI